MDIELFYREKGSGEPFILLHGNGEDSSYFEHQTAYFGNRYRVIAPDTRGHGASPRGDAPLRFRCRWSSPSYRHFAVFRWSARIWNFHGSDLYITFCISC